MITNLFKLFHFKLCEPQFSFKWECQMKYWTQTEAHLSKEQSESFLLTFLYQSTSSVFISPSFSVCHCLLISKWNACFSVLSLFCSCCSLFIREERINSTLVNLPEDHQHSCPRTLPSFWTPTSLFMHTSTFLSSLFCTSVIRGQSEVSFIDNGSRKWCFSEMNKWLSRHSTCWCYKINKAQWHNLWMWVRERGGGQRCIWKSKCACITAIWTKQLKSLNPPSSFLSTELNSFKVHAQTHIQ